MIGNLYYRSQEYLRCRKWNTFDREKSAKEFPSENMECENAPLAEVLSLQGHRMVYNGDFGMAGVEIETPEGMLISFSGKHALERFIKEHRLSAEDGAALRAIDARADALRSPHTWAPGAPRASGGD